MNDRSGTALSRQPARDEMRLFAAGALALLVLIAAAAMVLSWTGVLTSQSPQWLIWASAIGLLAVLLGGLAVLGRIQSRFRSRQREALRSTRASWAKRCGWDFSAAEAPIEHARFDVALPEHFGGTVSRDELRGTWHRREALVQTWSVLRPRPKSMGTIEARREVVQVRTRSAIPTAVIRTRSLDARWERLPRPFADLPRQDLPAQVGATLWTDVDGADSVPRAIVPVLRQGLGDRLLIVCHGDSVYVTSDDDPTPQTMEHRLALAADIATALESID